MTMTIDELTSAFCVPGLRFEIGNGGMIKAVVDSPFCKGEVYLHGAHVAQFQPSGQPPVLWISDKSLFEPGKAIRGGVPICFPWFGPLATDPKAPGHGYARTKTWEFVDASVLESGGIAVKLHTVIDLFDVTYLVVFGNELTISLTVQVTTSASGPMEFEEALHTYLVISDIKNITIDGLEPSEYIDKVDGAKRKSASGAAIRFNGECDRVYLDTTATCTLRDPGLNRSIVVSKSNSLSTVVWNPYIEKSAKMADFGDDEWPGMVCIETANVGPVAIKLLPGESHTMTAKITSVAGSVLI